MAQAPASLRCSLCGAPVPDDSARACGLCAAPHHGDCWEYTGMCSAYGCGGIVAVAWTAAMVPREIEIDGSPGERALALRTLWTSLRRRGRDRARDLPATLVAGGVGGAVATASLLAGWVAIYGSRLLGYESFWYRGMLPYAAVFLGCGLTYGLASPFLAPLQHRRPGAVTLVSGLLALTIYLGAPEVSFLVAAASGWLGILSAATLGERLLGTYRPMGRRLGRAAAPLRYLLVGSFFFACSIGAVLARGFVLRPGLLMECLAWGLLAALGGGHALEVGKEEYRKHLVARIEGAPPEPPEDDG